MSIRRRALAISAAAALLAPWVAPRGAAAGNGPYDVMSYNVQWGAPYGSMLDDAARVIARAGADILGAQELRRFAGSGLKGGPYDCSDQPKKLAGMLKELTGVTWYWKFGKDNGGRVVHGVCVGKATQPHEQGVAVFSKYPIVSSAVHTLSYSRALVQAKVATPDGRTVTVFTVHLDCCDAYKRDVQARQVASIVGATGGRKVLTGDMNAKVGSSTHAILSAVARDTWLDKGVGTGATRNSRIDYVFYKTSLLLDSVKVIQEWASDHRPVQARLYLQ
jgi:endonuclease/exonuclease/phosphatase family metal-dependent hydrolase